MTTVRSFRERLAAIGSAQVAHSSGGWFESARLGKGLLDPRRLRIVGSVALAWMVVAVVSATQGQILAGYQGQAQLWWPSLGYSVAIFSVWALLTPALLRALQFIDTLATPLRRLLSFALALPAFTGLHVAAFALLFWPVYGDPAGGPTAMAKPVLLANMDKAIFAFGAILVAARLLRRRGMQGDAVPPAADPPTLSGLWIRSGSATQFVSLDEIDWIKAAGDYAEIHTGKAQLLADRSLSDLAAELPAKAFARIHRSAIVRVDRIHQVQPVGRGDARISLRSGEVLRLSRRYRANLAGHIGRP